MTVVKYYQLDSHKVFTEIADPFAVRLMSPDPQKVTEILPEVLRGLQKLSGGEVIAGDTSNKFEGERSHRNQ